MFASAAFINAVHICAGKDPPVTVSSPPTPDMEIGFPFASSFAISTAAASCGVYPTNQALLLSSVVPVLPAAGRPSACAAKPDPFVTTLFNAYVTVFATPESIAWVSSGLNWNSSPPFAPITLLTVVVEARAH